jgi:hypothetical protein
MDVSSVLGDGEMDINEIRNKLGETDFNSFCDLIMDIPEWAIEDATPERRTMLQAFKKAITQ